MTAESSQRQRAFNEGAAVRDGKLYVFSSRRVIVIRGWPMMRAWTRDRRQPYWRCLRPALYLAGEGATLNAVAPRHRDRAIVDWRDSGEGVGEFENAAARGRALREEERCDRTTAVVAAYFSNVPRSLVRSVSRFPGRHWHLAAMAARSPAAWEILNDNPAMGYCLASCWVFDGGDSASAMRRIRALARRRRDEICFGLGFGNESFWPRILRKITPGACIITWLRRLPAVMAESHLARALHHLATINPTVLYVATHPRVSRLVSSRFLHELAENTRDSALAGGVVRRLGQMADIAESGAAEPGTSHRGIIKSLSHMYRLHEKWTADEGGLRFRGLKFPPPPFAGEEGIAPLETPSSLRAESAAQRHCVWSYAPMVAAGRLYCYRMTFPERCTFCLERSGRRWGLREIRGFRNAAVSYKTWQHVVAWLNSQGRRTDRGSRQEKSPQLWLEGLAG